MTFLVHARAPDHSSSPSFCGHALTQGTQATGSCPGALLQLQGSAASSAWCVTRAETCSGVQSPLQPRWNRVLQVGDASGIQSPLSFGGFGALTRHLGRLRSAITEALEAEALDKDSLAQVNILTDVQTRTQWRM